LPKNAIFGGFFRPDAEEAANGRLVFEPAPERTGLVIASGLVMLEHLMVGIYGMLHSHRNSIDFPPIFYGALLGFMGRQFGRTVKTPIYRRVVLRTSEVFWFFLCVLQESCPADCSMGTIAREFLWLLSG
jgi:hypothetical protein